MPSRRVAVVAAVCVGYGSVLALRPSDDTEQLARLIGVGLVVLAASFLVRRSDGIETKTYRATGAIWASVGIGAMVWRDPTVRDLAIVIGIALALTGIVEIVASFVADSVRRPLAVVGGATSVLLGVAVVSWPTATTLLLAVVVGGRLVIAGIGLLLEQWIPELGARSEGRAWRRWRFVGSAAGLILAAGLAVVAVGINRAQPDEPGAFYETPTGELGPPGTLIRSEIVEPFLAGTIARRILYVTTDVSGTPVTSSGLVIVADEPAPVSGRPVLAFTHGTIGIARRCAPSLLPSDVYAPALPGLADFLAEGFVFVATDYAGLGSDADTGYLIGEDEAYSTLDSVRAAQQIDDVAATPDFVTFGESQGGHAALFAGELAAEYSPELRLRGVVAAAPATDLTTLFAENVGTTFGNVLAAYALTSWSTVYGVGLDDVVETQARPVIERLSEMCIQTEAQMAALLPEAELLKLRFLHAPPWEIEPWATILAANTPGSMNIDAPVLVAQGADDPLVIPDVQRAFVDEWCARGQTIEYRVLDGVGHLDAGRASAPAAAEWASDRVGGVAWTGRCPSAG